MATRARDLLRLLAVAVLLTATPTPGWTQEAPPPPADADTKAAADLPPAEPIDDRWRLALPPYSLNETGRWWDPYHQNVLKGDFPIIGEDIFMKLTAISKTNVEGRS